MYTLNLMRIALELAFEDHVYEDIATKFFEHFLYIAEAMTNMGGDGIGLWDEEDEFYLRRAEPARRRARAAAGALDGRADPALRRRGARTRATPSRLPEFTQRAAMVPHYRPDLAKLVSRWQEPGAGIAACCRCCAAIA